MSENVRNVLIFVLGPIALGLLIIAAILIESVCRTWDNIWYYLGRLVRWMP